VGAHARFWHTTAGQAGAACSRPAQNTASSF